MRHHYFVHAVALRAALHGAGESPGRACGLEETFEVVFLLQPTIPLIYPTDLSGRYWLKFNHNPVPSRLCETVEGAG